MDKIIFYIKTITCVLFLLTSTHLHADEIRIAVASNFKHTMLQLSQIFERDSGHKVILIFGSTGKHFAQIKNAAPYDIFFAADVKRPELLEQSNLTVADSRFTYATGKLVLWSSKKNYIDPRGDVLHKSRFRHLAIANPKLAPYGLAAQQSLQSLDLWHTLKGKLIRGENIAQTFLFVHTGNAELGLLAYSQIKKKTNGSWWMIPESYYSPIHQQAVLLKDKAAAREFLHYVKSDSARKIIHFAGYK